MFKLLSLTSSVGGHSNCDAVRRTWFGTKGSRVRIPPARPFFRSTTFSNTRKTSLLRPRSQDLGFERVVFQVGKLAKRFIDTDLDKKEWFKSAPLTLQAAYQFILRDCDSAGIWNVELDILAIRSKAKITISELLETFNLGKERIRKLETNKLWLVWFCKFQYGKLSPSSPPHKTVISKLKENNLWDEYMKTVKQSDSVIIGVTDTLIVRAQEEEKEKEEDKYKEKEKEKQILLAAISAFKQKYPGDYSEVSQ